MVLIGLSGVAGSGKDFFSSLCVDYFQAQSLTTRTFSFADEVKLSLNDFITERFGFSSFTEDRRNKDIIRPITIGFAEGMKLIKGDDYWSNQIFDKLKSYDFADVVIIKDVRFPVEVSQIKKFNGSLIHISRYNDVDGVRIMVQPWGKDEEKNNRIMMDNASVKFTWPELTELEATQHVSTFLAEVEPILLKQCSIL